MNFLRSKAQYYTYGASFGGPIIKDKLFFFVNGEYEDNVTAGSNYRPRTALGESYSGGNIHRPLQSDMDDMRGFLLNKYNFDPGESIMTIQRIPLLIVLWHVLTGMLIKTIKLVSVLPRHIPKILTSLPVQSVHYLHQLFIREEHPLKSWMVNPVGTIAPGQGRTSKYALSFSNSTIIKCVILLLLQV